MTSLCRSLIGGFISLAFLITAATASTPEPFFMNVQLSDSYTGSTNCTDVDHWFLIEADVFVPQGTSNDIYLTVPEDFTSLPNGTFPLRYNSETMGVVSNNGSNILKVSTEGKTAENVTASFNFLAQMTADAKEEIDTPRAIDYTFEVSTGSNFTTSINYVAQNILTLNSNGGIFGENSTAWFTADIPLSLLGRPLYFTSQGTANTTYYFNTTLTSVEIVVAVDDFNQPKLSFPFSAVTDLSDSSHIKLLFNSTVDGGKYLRVKYFTNVLTAGSIGNTISLDYASGFSKRDSALTVTSNLYSSTQSNLQSQDVSENSSLPSEEDESSTSLSTTQETYETYYLETTTDPGIYTEVGSWIPISTSSKYTDTLATTSSSVASSIGSSTQSTIQSTLSSSSSFSSSFQSNSLLPTTIESSYLNSSSTSSLQSAESTTGKQSYSTRINAAERFLTYSVVTTTINGEVITVTKLTPISTLSVTQYSTQAFYSNETASTRSKFLTAALGSIPSVSRSTLLPSVTDYSKLASTSSSSLSQTKSKLESSKIYSNATSVTESYETTESPSAQSKTQEIVSYETYAVITKDDTGAFITYASLRPLSTINPDVASEVAFKVETSSRRTYVAVTKDDSAALTSQASFPSLSTARSISDSKASQSSSNAATATSKNGAVTDSSSSPLISTQVSSVTDSPSSPLISTQVSSVTDSPSSPLIQTQSNSGTDSSSSLLIQTQSNSGTDSSSSLLIQTQLTSTGGWQTSHSILMYQDKANSASTGLGGLLVSFALLWVL